MPTTTTVAGGQSVTWNVAPDVFSAAQQALNQFVQGWAPSSLHVDTVSVTDASAPGTVTIYNVPGVEGGTLNVHPGHNAVILSDDPASTTVNMTGMMDLVIDNNAAHNTINLGGPGHIAGPNGGELMGSGTVIAGDGNNTITIKGDASVVVGSGNDTITLGSPNDTVVSYGSATVHGPLSIEATVSGGQLLFQSGAGGESVTAGSGSATLAGGGTTITFVGGTGQVSMVGGTGNDTFVGGTGALSQDTMNAGAGVNVFSFETGTQPEGGTHIINNFSTANDFIHFGSGYDAATILADPTKTAVVSGNTVITLDGGLTKIQLNGITDPTQIKHN